ncbi:MAG TPA: hypothetical protein VL049_17370 [Candidatus Dormibacteraeota bacterium]|nr:hypothetical protein [Candidatus Dormibacteraeota bacterium]
MVRAVPATWSAFYATELQACWALLPVPALYLVWRVLAGRPRAAGALPAAAAFIDGYAVAFALETMLDPLATGPLLRALGVADGAAGTAVMIVFVLLGDFRVYLLLFALLAVAEGRSWRAALPTAAAWTLLVPLTAYPLSTAVRAARPAADPNTIWLLYESLFALVALALRARLVPRRVPGDQPALRAFLREALAYAALYYGLWGGADALIQLGGLDVGWLLRVVPNQLYYAFWIPFVVVRFFARR